MVIENKSKIRSIEISAKLVAAVFLFWAVGTLIALSTMTSGQPTGFRPLQVDPGDGQNSLAEKAIQWRAEILPQNIDTFVRADAYDSHFAVADEVEESFRESLLKLNEGLSWEFRSYWAITQYLKWPAICAIAVGFLSLLRVRIASAFVMCLVAILGLPNFTSLFGGPFETSFANSTYWFSAPLLIFAMGFAALAIYRWQQFPIPAEVAKDWKMFGAGFACFVVGSLCVVAAIVGRVNRVAANTGVPAALGVYLMCRHGWKLKKHYRALNNELDSEQATGQIGE